MFVKMLFIGYVMRLRKYIVEIVNMVIVGVYFILFFVFIFLFVFCVIMMFAMVSVISVSAVSRVNVISEPLAKVFIIAPGRSIIGNSPVISRILL